MRWSEPNTSLYNQDTFYPSFMRDLVRARKQVIIESPFLTLKRTRVLLPVITKLVRRGVKVVVNTKPFEEHDEMLRDTAYKSIAALQEAGVQVLMTIGHHRKLAIIDSEILWEGSLNILSQNDSCEIMRRIHSQDITKQTVQFLHLDRYYGME